MRSASGRSEVYRAARNFAAEMQTYDDLDLAALAYIERYPHHPPDVFHRSRRANLKEAATLLTDGWASRLVSCLDRPHLYTLRHHNIGLPVDAGDPTRLYAPDAIAAWKTALYEHLEPPYYWLVEAGKTTLHAHALGSGPQKLAHLAPSEVIKPIDDMVGAVAYALKPAAVYTAANLATFWRAKRNATGNLPRRSGPVGIPNARTYGKPMEA
jgi:hypothetical protein